MHTPIFQSIDCIIPNSKLSCSLYVYISSLRYQSLKFRSTFDYCRDMAGPIKTCFHCPWLWQASKHNTEIISDNHLPLTTQYTFMCSVYTCTNIQYYVISLHLHAH